MFHLSTVAKAAEGKPRVFVSYSLHLSRIAVGSRALTIPKSKEEEVDLIAQARLF